MSHRSILAAAMVLASLSHHAGATGTASQAGASNPGKNCITVLDPATGQLRQECKGLDLDALKQSKGGKPQFTRTGDCP